MTKLLVMSDLHLTPGAERIVGLDPLERFLQALDHAAQRHPDADRLILTGDLTHFGDCASYLKLRKALSDRPWPVSPLLGNHDRRKTFLEVFPETPVDENGFVQSTVDLGGVRLITLDSLDEDREVIEHAGYLCQDRLDWFADQLATAEDVPCLVFLHHPPFRTGFTGMDEIMLQSEATFRETLAKGPVAHVFAGHVHRTITSNLGGIPVTLIKSTCHQMPMLLGADGSHHSIDEPGGYGIVLTTGAEVVVHFEDVLSGD